MSLRDWLFYIYNYKLICKLVRRYLWLEKNARWSYRGPINGGNHNLIVPYRNPGYASTMEVFFKTNMSDFNFERLLPRNEIETRVLPEVYQGPG
jgi:hypothetical protein